MGNEQICNMLRDNHDYSWYCELARSFLLYCYDILDNEWYENMGLNYEMARLNYEKAWKLVIELQMHHNVKALCDESLDLLAELIIENI